MISVPVSKANSAASVYDLDRHTQAETTPSKALDKDMQEEDEPAPKDTGVTFNDESSDHGVPVIKTEVVTSIASDPLVASRRAKARNRSAGRQPEAFTRADQAWTRWENHIYDSLFTDMPNGESTVIAAFTCSAKTGYISLT